MRYTYRDDGWFYRTFSNAALAYHFSPTAALQWRHTFPSKPPKAILATFNWQATKYGHAKARVDGNSIIYPNLGDDFITRRQRLGWQETVDDIFGFLALLESLWPNQVVSSKEELQVKLTDLVVSESGQVLCVDWKRAIVGEKNVKKSFPTLESYTNYLIECLQASWLDFLKKHGQEISEIQKDLEDRHGYSHVEAPGQFIFSPEILEPQG